MKNSNFAINKKIILFVCSIFLLANSVFAARVIDNAGVLDSSEVTELLSYANKVENKYEIGVYIVCVNDPEMVNVEQYSESIYKNNNFGCGEEKNGILLFMNFAERDYDICCYGNTAHSIFTDKTKEYIANSFLYYFRDNDWYDGFYDFIESADYYISAAKEVEIRRQEKADALASGTIDAETLKSALLIGFGISLLIALIICLAMKSKMKSVKKAKRADQYIVDKAIKLNVKHDVFTHNTVVVHDLPQSSSSSGGGHTSVNSGGFSHHSGKF